MKMLHKHLLPVFLVLALTLSLIPAAFAAEEIPKSYWQVQTPFETACANGDTASIISYGEQIVTIASPMPAGETKYGLLGGVYMELAEAYESRNDFVNAKRCYAGYEESAVYFNWTDGILLAQRKQTALSPVFALYTESAQTTAPQYGAKFEPKTGAYYGASYSADSRIPFGQPISAVQKYYPHDGSFSFIYLEFGASIDQDLYRTVFEQAAANNKGVMVCWNTYSPLADVQSHANYIQQTIDFLGAQNVPVFLRFAAEMNDGPNGTDAAAYRNSFAYVATRAKQKSNIAMVWAVVDMGNLYRNLADYYPGDQYVDWIGIQLYPQLNFGGSDSHGTEKTEEYNTFFFSGGYSHPILRVTPTLEFMKENNIQKPVMISESGAAHYNNKLSKDTTDYSVVSTQRMYGELFRMYPQIKAIFAFNTDLSGGAYKYGFFSNSRLNDAYQQMVSSDFFMNSIGNAPSVSYVPMKDVTLNRGDKLQLSAVGYYPKDIYNLKVVYSIDGTQLAAVSSSPYQYTLDTAALTPGSHTLRAVLQSNGKDVATLTYSIQVAGQALPELSVTVNGKPVDFPDQLPIIVDGRTLVPARAVFEAMGLSVAWDAATRSATISSDKTSVVVKIGSKMMDIDSIDGDNDARIVELDVPAQIINDRTMLPLRAISEAFHADVQWDAATRTVSITY